MTTQPTTHPEESTSTEPQQTHQSTWGIVAGVRLMSTGVAAHESVPASVTPLVRESLHIGPVTCNESALGGCVPSDRGRLRDS